MAATPYTGTIIFMTQQGREFTHTFTGSDVTADFVVMQDGGIELTLPATEGFVAIKDVILSAAGADTKQIEVFVNSKNTGLIVSGPSNVGSVFNRQFMSSPMRIAAGSSLKLRQLT